MEAKRIDLTEWEYFGEGGSSKSYTYKMDGNIVLKLNSKDIPAAKTEQEYLASKAFHDAGFPSPAIFDLVTDGERLGYTSRRVKGKMSYARILSQEPDRTDELASKFAALALDLHRTPADVTKMKDARAELRKAIGELSNVPEGVAEVVEKCFAAIGSETSCLHGDMNPGNLISFEGRDNWIGVNEFAYGDPFLDIATMHIICNCLPVKMVSSLYHADRRRLKLFYKAFKKAYFGEGWNSSDVRDHISCAAVVRLCAYAADKPGYADILASSARKQKIRFFLRRIFPATGGKR